MSRQLVNILDEIAQENDLDIETFSDDWVIRLSKGDKKTFIIGYTFDCNSAATDNILKDKSALYCVLSDNNIPAVEHYYSESNYRYIDPEIVYREMLALINKYKKLIIKDNKGTCGRLIYRANNIEETMSVIDQMKSQGIKYTISPYYDIVHEYRVVMCYGEPRLVYDKIRPTIKGDGVHTIAELAKDAKHIDSDVDLSYIPNKNEKVLLSWTHNLSNGAKPKIVKSKQLYERLTTIAKESCRATNADIASVDIIDTGKEYKVLEINGGLMLKYFSMTSNSNYSIAKDIYYDCIRRPLGLTKK